MFESFRKKPVMVTPGEALPGRAIRMAVQEPHAVSGHSLSPPWPEGYKVVCFGMGCFWGAERRFWGLPGVWLTAVGYAGGYTPNPTYEEVCTGLTGHAEVVQVVYDPQCIEFESLLSVFWESHDPTQGMRQGNDLGTQYRSCLYVADSSGLKPALDSRDRYQSALIGAGRYGEISTEIAVGAVFYYAESYHQQYLAKNPGGYCGLEGLGVKLPCFRIGEGEFRTG